MRRGRHCASATWACAFVALAAVNVIACSNSSDSGDSGAASPCDVATSCPTDVPSYKTDIAPIIQQACATCHSPDGSAGFSETTYADVYAQRSSMLSQVAICQMPPLNGPVMSDAQRVALTGWLECGAPDN